MTKQCVFVGPTLPIDDVPCSFDVYGPAALGALFWAVENDYQRIVLIDGNFGMVPSVWHKEILWALSNSVEVIGASSMGALRAVETKPYGMVGIGRVFNLYRFGVLTDDDEVAVAHGETEVNYIPVSEAMVNFRYTLKRMVREKLITTKDATIVAARMKAKYFPNRTREEFAELLDAIGLYEDQIAKAQSWYHDVKYEDAKQALDRFASGPEVNLEEQLWSFPKTLFWSEQTIAYRSELPIPNLRRPLTNKK